MICATKPFVAMGQDQAYDYLQSVDFISQDQLILIKSVPETLKMLSSGKGDAVLIPKLVGLVFIKRMNLTNLEMSPIVIEAYNRPFCFSVKEGNQALLERLTQGMMHAYPVVAQAFIRIRNGLVPMNLPEFPWVRF
ncbi:MAG: hypothetical protein GY737_30275 [Desulfobacteraceae bacterium]|nr:hypothetical protein [Desulfobacteraceae bacterium]